MRRKAESTARAVATRSAVELAMPLPSGSALLSISQPPVCTP
nr:hypothetical protein [Streptosporangium amethystogenes]